MSARFIPGARETTGKYQNQPFGAGPRICIGAGFAIQEAVFMIGMLLSRYRFDMVPAATDRWAGQKLTTQPVEV